MDTEVLIVGAGPTGLMLANQLAMRGVRAVIIDRHSGPAQQTRAIAVQARTLEIYAKMDLAQTALNLGLPATGANLWANGEWAARIPLGDIGKDLSPFPFALILGQDDNERMMGAKLHSLGVDVQWMTELVGLQQHADHVEVTLKDAAGVERRMKAGWIAGCDGAHSAVRTLSGIAFPGDPYPHVFFVADTEATGPMKPGELNIYLWRDGFHLFFPMRGTNRWRVIGILPEAFRDRSDLAFDMLVPAIKKEAGAEVQFALCSWFSTYRISHRMAERFRDRRCFLLGDTAHIHSPAGGQGMNTGLQDAYNLAWKLAYVVKGQADMSLLDTYEQDRVPVARRLLETTDRAFQLLVSERWTAAVLRTRIISRLAAIGMRIDRVRKLAFATVSQIGISYPDSALSQTLQAAPSAGPAAGARFPWLKLNLSDGTEVSDLFSVLDAATFNLLLFGEHTTPPPANNELMTVLRVPVTGHNTRMLGAVGITQPAFYLVRPDGYIGLVGGPFDHSALDRYVRRFQAASSR